MPEDRKEPKPKDLTDNEAAAQVNGGGSKEDIQIDDLMEAAGFAKDTAADEVQDEAAQLYTEDTSYVPGYTVDDQIEIQRSLADRLGIDYIDIAEFRPKGSY